MSFFVFIVVLLLFRVERSRGRAGEGESVVC